VVQEIQSTTTGTARAAASATLSAIPVQVYIQIGNQNQKPRAEAVRAALQEKGYVVPAIENVAGKADLPKRTNVRYFNVQDKSVAEDLVKTLREHGSTSAYAYAVSRLKVKPGSLEIWYSPEDIA